MSQRNTRKASTGDETDHIIVPANTIPFEVPPKEGFDFSRALESVYPLLELIFDYLPFTDLKSASKVKKSWQETADTILNQRNSPSWMCISRHQNQYFVGFMGVNRSQKRTGSVSCSSQFLFKNKTCALVFFNYYAVSLNDKLKLENPDVKIKLKDFILEMMIPEGIKYCIIGCPGLSPLSSIPEEIPKSKLQLTNALFLPNIPNVDISIFHYNFSQEYSFPHDERPKCLLIFCKSDLKDIIFTILEQLVPRSSAANVAVAGGIIRNSVVFPCNSMTPMNSSSRRIETLCITFRERSTDESKFDAYSVVITGADLTNEVFKKQLIQFKQRISMRTNSIAIRICCAAKPVKRFETKSFNEVFPHVQLMGMEVDGEIGWNCPAKEPGDLPAKKKSKSWYPQVQHQWSTTFVILTWDK